MANVSATSIRLGSPFTPMSYTKAKPETVKKVMEIVKKQLALSDDVALTPESKLSVLGADSLDTVEIVMGLEEEFGISVEEDNSQNITTVQEAADLIEKLVQKKSEAAN
ncbi:acyl carrier protein 1, chloroplastic-like isoform X2 [Ananas comosus]|uniref:Acyl carrier protein n=1 Tax=Ananas comosus TaxID=4615 RepID=A0A199V0I7_ANACO|nr:acyl carrier protein 1, chloroplastic-like isoform X2 [Ananas comosus]OAY70587.1 Acyl carrier protein 1, chloroplastic [Ananas comosus]